MHVLSMERRVSVVEHLTDGSGVRAASRLTRVHKTTILSLILKLGEGCSRLHNRLVRGLSINRIECDEMHSFIGVREKNKRPDQPLNEPKIEIFFMFIPDSGMLNAQEINARDLRYAGRAYSMPI